MMPNLLDTLVIIQGLHIWAPHVLCPPCQIMAPVGIVVQSMILIPILILIMPGPDRDAAAGPDPKSMILFLILILLVSAVEATAHDAAMARDSPPCSCT